MDRDTHTAAGSPETWRQCRSLMDRLRTSAATCRANPIAPTWFLLVRCRRIQRPFGHCRSRTFPRPRSCVSNRLQLFSTLSFPPTSRWSAGRLCSRQYPREPKGHFRTPGNWRHNFRHSIRSQRIRRKPIGQTGSGNHSPRLDTHLFQSAQHGAENHRRLDIPHTFPIRCWMQRTGWQIQTEPQTSSRTPHLVPCTEEDERRGCQNHRCLLFRRTIPVAEAGSFSHFRTRAWQGPTA